MFTKMFKCCWDCIASYESNNRERRENGDAYGVRFNGDTQQSPAWPVLQPEQVEMFLLPKQLKPGDKMSVSGYMRNNPESILCNLVTGYNSPDYNNIACQVDVNFSRNDVQLKVISNGVPKLVEGDYQTIPASEWFTDTNFTFLFHVVESDTVSVTIGVANVEELTLKHSLSDIRYLALQGDIDKVDRLDFQFG